MDSILVSLNIKEGNIMAKRITLFELGFLIIFLVIFLSCAISGYCGEHRESEWVEEKTYSPKITALIKRMNRGERFSWHDLVALEGINDPRLVDVCIRALKFKELCANAAKILGDLRDKKAIKPLMDMIDNKSLEPISRYVAIEALGKIGSRQAVPFLKQKLKEELGKFEWRVRNKKYYGTVEIELKSIVIIALYMLGERKYESQVIGYLVNSPGIADVEFVRKSVMTALEGKELGEESISRLIKKGLTSEYRDVKLFTIKKLGQLRVQRAVKPLMKLLSDKDPFIQQKAIESLGMLGDKRAIESLIKILKKKSYKPYKLKKAAAEALSRIGEPAAKELIELLKSEDKRIRLLVMDALIKIGSPEVSNHLIGMLKDKEPLIWSKAAIGLAKLKVGDPVKFLLEKLKSSDNQVRIYAISSLGEIGDKRAVEPLCKLLSKIIDSPRWGEMESLGREIITALGKLKDKRAVPILINYLRSEKVYHLQPIYLALGRIGGNDALKYLKKFYFEGERERKIPAQVSFKFKEENREAFSISKFRDDKGRYWAIFISWIYGSPDIWIANSADGEIWRRPIFTGLTAFPGTSPQLRVKENKIFITYIKHFTPTEENLLEKRWLMPEKFTTTLLELTKDSDQDGLTDLEEKRFKTNPFKADTDGDGLIDGKDRNPLVGPKTKMTEKDLIRQAVFSYWFKTKKSPTSKMGIDPVLIVKTPDGEKQEFLGYQGIVLNLNEDEVKELMKEVGESICIFSIEKIKFNITKTKAKVEISNYYGPKAAQGFEIILEKKGGIWVIVEERMTWIS